MHVTGDHWWIEARLQAQVLSCLWEAIKRFQQSQRSHRGWFTPSSFKSGKRNRQEAAIGGSGGSADQRRAKREKKAEKKADAMIKASASGPPCVVCGEWLPTIAYCYLL